MKITSKGRYALRIYLDVAKNNPNGDIERPLRVWDVCKRQNIPYDYAQQVITKMRKAGIMDSARGPGGGVFIVPNTGKTLLDLFVAVGESNLCLNIVREKEEKATKGTHELNTVHKTLSLVNTHALNYFRSLNLEVYAKDHVVSLGHE